MGKGGTGVMREPETSDPVLTCSTTEGATDAMHPGSAAAPDNASADDAGATPSQQQVEEQSGDLPHPAYDDASLYDESGRLVVNLDMFRDDQFVQDKIMPLRHVPLLTPRSEEALRRQGLLVEEIMPHFGPAYSIDTAKYVEHVALTSH